MREQETSKTHAFKWGRRAVGSTAGNGAGSLLNQQRTTLKPEFFRLRIPAGIIISGFLSLLVSFALLSQVSGTILTVWLSVLLVTLTAEAILATSLRRGAPTRDIAISRLRLIDALTLLSGVVWGLSAIFLFPTESLHLQYVLSFSLVALGCSTAFLHAIDIRVCLATLVALFTPLVCRLVFFEDGDDRLLVGIILAAVTTALSVIAVFHHRLISRYLNMRLDNERLCAALEEEKSGRPELDEKLALEISRRQETQEALFESEKRFRILVETAGDIIWTVDLNLKYTYVSPSVERVLGYTVEEIMNMNPLDTLDEHSREKVSTALMEELNTAREPDAKDAYPIRTELIRQFCKDGSGKWMEIATTFLRDSSGAPTGILGISRDVSERREIDRAQAGFATMVSHELRTPLTAILGNSELLLIEDHLSPQDRQDCLSAIHRQAIHLNEIVSDLLDVSRIEFGTGIPLHLKICDISAIIHEVVKTVGDASVNHQLELDLPETPIELMADKYRVRQLFWNLLSNAVKYSPDGGAIQLKCESFDDYLLFTVADHGIGMSSEQVSQAFKKFYSADRSTTGIAGAGLGMTIVKYIVEARGGSVWIKSALGEGTKIQFTFPLEFGAPIQDGGRREENIDC